MIKLQTMIAQAVATSDLKLAGAALRFAHEEGYIDNDTGDVNWVALQGNCRSMRDDDRLMVFAFFTGALAVANKGGNK
jgi:hypothetical protein